MGMDQAWEWTRSWWLLGLWIQLCLSKATSTSLPLVHVNPLCSFCVSQSTLDLSQKAQKPRIRQSEPSSIIFNTVSRDLISHSRERQPCLNQQSRAWNPYQGEKAENETRGIQGSCTVSFLNHKQYIDIFKSSWKMCVMNKCIGFMLFPAPDRPMEFEEQTRKFTEHYQED